MSEPRIREAASVLCVRDGEGGPQVLVVERGSASRFLPGYIAFPGGAVEQADAERAVRWFGDPAEASRAAAVRELLEEVGLGLTGRGIVSGRSPDALAAVDASPPAADDLREVARWIAPPVVPVRFDARYYGVASAPDVEPEPDGGEASAAWWVAPGRLLEEWGHGERKLYWPTYFTMQKLAGCGSLEEILALRFPTREPNDDEIATLPRSVMEQD